MRVLSGAEGLTFGRNLRAQLPSCRCYLTAAILPLPSYHLVTSPPPYYRCHLAVASLSRRSSESGGMLTSLHAKATGGKRVVGGSCPPASLIPEPVSDRLRSLRSIRFRAALGFPGARKEEQRRQAQWISGDISRTSSSWHRSTR